MIKGRYTCYLNGEAVGTYDNTITTAGKNAILRYLAGMIPAYARTIAIGTLPTTPTTSDTDLGFEVDRQAITFGTVDVTDTSHKKVVFKASFPVGTPINIKEIGLFSYDKNPASGKYTGTTLAEFSTSESWTTESGADFIDTVISDGSLNRIGVSSMLSQQDTNGQTALFTWDFANIDLSGYSATDEIGLALGTYSSDIASVTLFLTDIDGAAASYTWTMPAYDSNNPYVILTVQKGAIDSSTFEWSQVDKISIGVTSTTDNNSKTVSNVARDATNPDIVTITTSANHGFAINDSVTISNLTNDSSSFNGTFPIETTPSNTTFTYRQDGNTVVTEAATGTSPAAVAQGWKVTNVARTSNVTTLTTSIAHGISVGQYIYVGNIGNSSDVNGVYIAKTGTTGSTVVYDNVGSNIVSAATTGTGPYVEIQSKLMLDGIRMFDSDVNNPDYTLISRTAPLSIYKDANSTLDVEYRLEVSL